MNQFSWREGHSQPGCNQCGSWCSIKKRPVTLSTGSPIPADLLDTLLLRELDWTWNDWGRVVGFYVGQALADSTQRSYSSANRQYIYIFIYSTLDIFTMICLGTCTTHNVTPSPLTIVAVSLCSILCQEQLSPNIDKMLFGAVRVYK